MSRAADAARFRFGPAALACCAGKRFAFPQLRTPSGSNPMRWAQTKTVPLRGPYPIQWWAMRDVRVRLRRPRPASSLRSSRAALVNACAFPQLRTLAGSNPSAMGPNKNGPLSRTVSNSVVGDEGCPRAASPPAPRFVASLLACCAGKRLRVSSAPHPGGFESLCTGPKKERPPSLGAFSIKWWAMRDSNPQPCACKAPALTVAPIARAERV